MNAPSCRPNSCLLDGNAAGHGDTHVKDGLVRGIEVDVAQRYRVVPAQVRVHAVIVVVVRDVPLAVRVKPGILAEFAHAERDRVVRVHVLDLLVHPFHGK